MSGTITTIDTAQTGTAGSVGQPNGGDGESLIEAAPPFSDENFTTPRAAARTLPKGHWGQRRRRGGWWG